MDIVYISRPAPVLNTADFHSVFGGVTGKEVNVRGFEFVALAGMQFQVIEQVSSHICRVQYPSYPLASLYLDLRFTQQTPLALHPPQLSRQQILSEMENLLGTPYVWGGNWSQGIPELLDYYPPKEPLDEKIRIQWTLSGVDCSGMLFQILNGLVPRNTSELLQFGEEVSFSSLEPLDMILYPGHVLFVFDESLIIESKFPFGVIRRDRETRLKEVKQERYFIARRMKFF